jgi:predicted enzyme related to lactoylglutathione lyase
MGIFPHAEVGCALCQHPQFYKPSDNGTLVYMNANPDLQNVQNRIENAGGKILMQKKQISGEHGYMCLFIDTEGNRLALHSSN